MEFSLSAAMMSHPRRAPPESHRQTWDCAHAEMIYEQRYSDRAAETPSPSQATIGLRKRRPHLKLHGAAQRLPCLVPVPARVPKLGYLSTCNYSPDSAFNLVWGPRAGIIV